MITITEQKTVIMINLEKNLNDYDQRWLIIIKMVQPYVKRLAVLNILLLIMLLLYPEKSKK